MSAAPVVARLLTPSSKCSNVAATPAATPAAYTVSVENEVSESASDPHSLRLPFVFLQVSMIYMPDMAEFNAQYAVCAPRYRAL